MTLKQIYIQNLKEFRKNEGLSQMKLAEYCGTAHSYIGEIEAGRKFPSMDLIEKIAQILKIEPYQFFIPTKSISESDRKSPHLPYIIKKQIRAKIKSQLKAQMKSQITSQINTQINAQVNISLKEILSEIDEILDRN